MIRAISLALVCLISGNLYSQDNEKKVEFGHYFGVQVNELIKQALNLSNSTTANHPFLLNYSYNGRKSGWGFNTGIGYTMTNTRAGDALLSIKTDIDDLNFRIGPDKKVALTNKWLLDFGLDVVYGELKNKTETKSVSTNPNFPVQESVVTERTNRRMGGGFRGGLIYSVNSRIFVGTEFTYYYFATENSSKNRTPTGLNQSIETVDKFKESDLEFNIPTALFIFIRF